MADKKKYYLQLARAIPATSNVQDFEAKRVLDAMAEILRKLLTKDVDSDSSNTGGGDTTDRMLTLVAGNNVTIDELPNDTRKISSKDTVGGGIIYDGRRSVNISGQVIDLKNDEQSPGNNEAYSTDATGSKGWNPVSNLMAVKNSIEMDANEAQLVGDEDSPGNDKVYGTDGAGAKGWQDGGGIDLVGTNDGDIIAWDQTTDEAFEVNAMPSLADNDQIQWDSATKKWEKCHGPHDPSSTDTVGSAAEGSEAAETTTKTFAGTDGLKFYVQSRTAYYHAGDKKLYGYSREMRFDRMGRLYYVGAETRFEIDVTVAG